MSATPLGSLRRSHTCGALRRADVGADCILLGWVHTIRDHGGVLFLDVRDRFGLTQVVVEPSEATGDAVAVARALGAEHVVAVTGRVAARPAGMVNTQLPTGDVEVRAREIRLLSPCLTLPFPLADEAAAAAVSEDLRLRYRFLDLRRAELQDALELRHRVMQRVRGALSGEGFIEIGTPLLVRPTPEGARDFIVPARLHPGSFYALPQSPQLYKQILMVAGFDRYFQLATCLRDEDLRADRQPEHQQIDLEMSFVGEEDVWGVIERMFTQVMQEVGVSIATPFPRLAYADAMARFGSDKPDIRFALELRDVSRPAGASQSGIFQRAVAEGGSVYALVVPASHALSRKDIDGLEALAKTHGAGGLAWTRVSADGGADGGVAKLLVGGADAAVFAACDATPGCTVLFAAGTTTTVQKALGAVRLDLGRRIYAPDPRDYRFVWIRDFPLFEWDAAEKRWTPAHHMFCMPRESDLDMLETDPGKVYARQYDLALNGTELGSGSIRIHTSALQRRVMKVVGLSEEQAREKFGFLLEALDYGAPPHGGIALGVDRIIMHLAGRDSIRDVIAFPKTARAASLMDGAPGRVDARDLDVLGIRVVEKAPASSS